MKTIHTPGPWKVKYSKFDQIVAENGAHIATCKNLNGLVNLQANAHLIAAAPEMLECLLQLFENDPELAKNLGADIAIENALQITITKNS